MVNLAPAGGVYTPVPTFFDAEGKIDIDTQIKHAIFLADNGIDGIVILGSTGEMTHLSRKERFQVVSETVKGLKAAGKESFKVYAGVAHDGVDDTLEEIDAMKEAGATIAMALAPNYFAPSTSQEGIVSWFTQVADRSSLPIIIYYFPGVCNNLVITPATVAKLSQHPNIVGIKQSHGNVSEYAQIALSPVVQKQDFAVWTGLGQLLLPAISVGVTGTIDAISGAFPKTLAKLYKLSVEGKTAEAQKLQYTVSKIEEIIVKHGPVGTKYAIHAATGFGIPVGRAPLDVALVSTQIAPFEEPLAEAIKLEKSL